MLAKLLQDILKDTMICTKGVSRPFPTAQNKKPQTQNKKKKAEKNVINQQPINTKTTTITRTTTTT
jgi:hypothetical protein